MQSCRCCELVGKDSFIVQDLQREFPKIRGTLFGVLLTRILLFIGYYIRVPYFRKLPYKL